MSLAWEPPPFSDRNGNIVMYNIRVREEETQTQLEYTSIRQPYTLTSLHPYYIYHISIAAVTVGTGPFTTSLQQQTAQSGEALAPLNQTNFTVPLVPSSAPGNFSMVATSATSLFLSWNELPLADRNGVIREYTVHLTNVATGEDTEYSAVAESYTITNLHPDYTYRGKVAAVTVVGAGPYSPPLEVRLPEAGNF